MLMNNLTDRNLRDKIEQLRKQSKVLEKLAELYEKELGGRAYENYPKIYTISEQPRIYYEKPEQIL